MPTLKSLDIDHGELYLTKGGRRKRLAEFAGRIDIKEEQKRVPILGQLYPGAKSIRAAFVVPRDVFLDDSDITAAAVYGAAVDVSGRRYQLDGMTYTGMDCITNEVSFEINDPELIKMLLESN